MLRILLSSPPLLIFSAPPLFLSTTPPPHLLPFPLPGSNRSYNLSSRKKTNASFLLRHFLSTQLPRARLAGVVGAWPGREPRRERASPLPPRRSFFHPASPPRSFLPRSKAGTHLICISEPRGRGEGEGRGSREQRGKKRRREARREKEGWYQRGEGRGMRQRATKGTPSQREQWG